ncbi:argininosuccinate lyase [Anatilimnocola sp. NA78]|uniref:argininosuccinate lyase n=1 Tax=Anatilimnocola sp. NA78 TaxID=3415683 RepID=UPI003CE46F7A
MATPSRSGVFTQATDRRVERFTESISFDRRLYAHDILGSCAHAQMLAEVGVLTPHERDQICATLQQIGKEIEHDIFPFSIALEDIHMHIEQALIERLGDVGRKLHTGRSRNDQVATDLRLWVRDALDRIKDRLENLQRAFFDRCEGDFEVILPGYTHMQRAQPVIAPHYWLAYCEKLARDIDRVTDCRRRTNVCSLGVAALAGTTIPIDRHDVMTRLGFESVAANSLDVSSDRDFVVESAFVLSLIAAHLSTWAEEWILWSTAEFNFIKLPQEFCTGSSIMPQKINPDVLELTRGKSARVIGHLQTLLVLIKGLPLAYNRDLQEDKPPLFDSFETVELCLELAAPLVAGMKLNREAIAAKLDRGYLDATTLMEYLIQKGIAQRTAHHLVGSLVNAAMQQGVSLAELPLETLQSAHPDLDESVREILGVNQAVAAFRSYGSTAPVEVRRQIEIWRSRLYQTEETDLQKDGRVITLE